MGWLLESQERDSPYIPQRILSIHLSLRILAYDYITIKAWGVLAVGVSYNVTPHIKNDKIHFRPTRIRILAFRVVLTARGAGSLVRTVAGREVWRFYVEFSVIQR